MSSREVLEAHLARVDAVNPHLNAVVGSSPRRRGRRRRRRSGRRRRRRLGPLHGVPITVKENIDVAGTPTTQGLVALADAIAADSTRRSSQRMRAAGAIPFARTNLPDFGLRVHTDSSLHGLTRNPWNPTSRPAGRAAARRRRSRRA